VGAIHGRLLTAWSVAGILGPEAMTWLREGAVRRAITDLAERTDPAAFASTFGAGIEQLELLVAERTVTISNLMDIVPPGTPDPSSGLYNTTMYLMAALLAVALLANAAVKPVSPQFHME
jgi:hypothetical protein